FKAVQIGVSAWTAEALKNTMPASVFSRSTECHNQDKVSMGTIAARDCLRNLELTEQVFAAVLLAASQAVNIRLEKKQLEASELTASVKTMLNDIALDFEILTEDRALESELRLFVQKIRDQQWRLYE
ncbi:MAG: aromatic amino acid ammonia-lyase, partial [Gammaproteobacteria bacterium]|nr:aromatic amino acid ammonia-lyase [Gammaproteobacteria bacterium]